MNTTAPKFSPEYFRAMREQHKASAGKPPAAPSAPAGPQPTDTAETKSDAPQAQQTPNSTTPAAQPSADEHARAQHETAQQLNAAQIEAEQPSAAARQQEEPRTPEYSQTGETTREGEQPSTTTPSPRSFISSFKSPIKAEYARAYWEYLMQNEAKPKRPDNMNSASRRHIEEALNNIAGQPHRNTPDDEPTPEPPAPKPTQAEQRAAQLARSDRAQRHGIEEPSSTPSAPTSAPGRASSSPQAQPQPEPAAEQPEVLTPEERAAILAHIAEGIAYNTQQAEEADKRAEHHESSAEYWEESAATEEDADARARKEQNAASARNSAESARQSAATYRARAEQCRKAQQEHATEPQPEQPDDEPEPPTPSPSTPAPESTEPASAASAPAEPTETAQGIAVQRVTTGQRGTWRAGEFYPEGSTYPDGTPRSIAAAPEELTTPTGTPIAVSIAYTNAEGEYTRLQRRSIAPENAPKIQHHTAEARVLQTENSAGELQYAPILLINGKAYPATKSTTGRATKNRSSEARAAGEAHAAAQTFAEQVRAMGQTCEVIAPAPTTPPRPTRGKNDGPRTPDAADKIAEKLRQWADKTGTDLDKVLSGDYAAEAHAILTAIIQGRRLSEPGQMPEPEHAPEVIPAAEQPDAPQSAPGQQATDEKSTIPRARSSYKHAPGDGYKMNPDDENQPEGAILAHVADIAQEIGTTLAALYTAAYPDEDAPEIDEADRAAQARRATLADLPAVLDDLESANMHSLYTALEEAAAAYTPTDPIQPAPQPEPEPIRTGPKDFKRGASLRQKADALTKQIDAKINNATGQQRVTPKRARVAEGMRQEGYALQEVQKALYILADAHEAGTVPAQLATLKSTSEVQALIQQWKWRKFSELTEQNQALNKFIHERDTTTPEQREAQERAEKIKQHERELIGCKIPGYFPTPDKLAERVVREAGIEPGDRVLEPSAGKGNIADKVRELYGGRVSLSCIEVNYTLAEILEMKGHDVARRDFLEMTPPPFTEKVNRVVMNPPFENGQDADHIQHAFKFLKSGGRLVAITSTGIFYRSDKKATQFREWLQECGAVWEEIGAGAFYDSERPTGVNSMLVVIDK